MLVGPKGLTIISILMGLVAIFSLGLGVTATSKYRTQKHRVTELEEKILLGKEAMLKVPQSQLKAQEEATARQDVENQLTEATDEFEALKEEFEVLRHESELLAVGNAAGGRLLQQSEEAVKIAKTELVAAEETAATLAEENKRLKKQVAALDLDVRAAETKIRNLTKELGGETSSLYEGTQEGGEVSHLGFGLAVTGHEIGSPSELPELKQKVSDLTSELITLTKAKVSAEKEVAALQQRLAAR
ncbi:MAG: hypothetical protein NOU37_05685 [Candidatus Brocadiales bacterium]|nr:hypothetical protein [Candidatus Bathyanammoxibius amoris]